jgi:hypothetical protein
MNQFVTGVEPVAGDLGDAAWPRARTDESDGVLHAASPNDATRGSFDAAFLDVALRALAGSDRPQVHTGGPEPALLYAGNGKHRFANVHRDDIAMLYAFGVRTAPAGPYYLGANAHIPAMTELATAASRSRGLNGRIAAEPEAGSRARLGLFLATFMPLPDITVVNTALPSIQGEES